jgi:hypothetical protein
MSLAKCGYFTIGMKTFTTDAQMSQMQFFSVPETAMSLSNDGQLIFLT